MASKTDEFLNEWHRVVAEKDLDGLARLLAEDVSLGAPPYWPRFEGRAQAHHLLGLILDTIEGFSYRREWSHGSELALEFTGRVGELELQGIDLVSLDERFVVSRLDVLIRPANAVESLREIIAPQMARFLAGKSVENDAS
jgi:hypothetical protein